jgi:hypothetical protein
MVLVASAAMALPCGAQSPGVHYRYQGLEPPGAIGSWQLQRGGPLSGYFQPVEIKAPNGALVSLASQGKFCPPEKSPAAAGLLIGPVYRLRVTNIPQHSGREVYPTIEMIDRLYPPAGQARRFPIPIELTQADLELALEGKFVTRVVYLENPQNALPVATDRDEQRWYDAGPGSNPLEVADRLGRPVAIVRLGGRLPIDEQRPDERFLYGCPPYKVWSKPAGMPGETIPPGTTATQEGRESFPSSRMAVLRESDETKKTPDPFLRLTSSSEAADRPGKSQVRIRAVSDEDESPETRTSSRRSAFAEGKLR